MVCLVKNRLQIYKIIRADIWGEIGFNYYSERKKDNLRRSILFCCELRHVFNILRKNFRGYKDFSYLKSFYFIRLGLKRKKKNFLFPRLVKFYYLLLTKSSITSKVVLAKKKSGRFIVNLLKEFENRLFCVLYRIKWVSNIFNIKNLINFGYFFVNFKKVTYPNYVLKEGDLVQVKEGFKNFLKNEFKKSIKYKIIKFSIPSHIYISYVYIFFFLYKDIIENEVVYPIKLDFLRVLDFIGVLR